MPVSPDDPRIWFCVALSFLLPCALQAQSPGAHAEAITDQTNYNVGEVVRVRLPGHASVMATVRYAGETVPVAPAAPISSSDYIDLWRIPDNARTGRYEVDIAPSRDSQSTVAASFAVHRQFAKIESVELDKTFYTSGDSVNPTIVVRNLSDHSLSHLQVEFEPYTYPWIAPAPDDPKIWKHIVATQLQLGPGEERTFRVRKAAVVQAEKEPVANYYSVVIRDSQNPDRIYDLAFALPAFTRPPNTNLPKQYPFLYLYWHLRDVAKSESYGHFYPPEFVSDVIRFETDHTMFATGSALQVSFQIKPPGDLPASTQLKIRVLDAQQHALENQTVSGSVPGSHQVTLQPRPPGVYMVQVSLADAAGTVVARNQIEIAVNDLPKSILVFAAHQDDDTAHPGIIRAAAENHIPIHFVYFTGGDAGGCDRFFMHSCDAARAMEFGEVRMDESRASLGHLGIAPDNLFFLGLPDGGMGQIWYEHPQSSNPYLSVLLASEHAPYPEAAIPNLAYSREAAVEAAKRFIQQFNPQLIITGHPDERHVDHRTNNWIVVKAMQELLHQGVISRDTKLVVDVSYGAMPGRHAPYHYEKQLFYVSGEAAKLGQEALWYYESQDGNHQQAEIIDFNKLPRQEPYPHYRILDWFDHEGWNDQPPRPQ